MHLKRWITAIVAIPLIFLLLFSGPPFLLTFFLGLTALFTLREFFRIAFKGHEKIGLIFSIPAYIAAVGIIGSVHFNRMDFVLMILSFDMVLAGFVSLPYFKMNQNLPELVAKQVLSIVYIPTFISFLILLRDDPEGRGWVFLVLCLVAAGDVAAYYVGSYFGKNKLCPAVSPNKTIEGSLGGLCANLIIGLVFAEFFIGSLTWPKALIIAVLVGIAGQVGDLFESEFKRAADVKDSGRLLPGHGGMLDRIDALLFASPIAYILKELIF